MQGTCFIALGVSVPKRPSSSMPLLLLLHPFYNFSYNFLTGRESCSLLIFFIFVGQGTLYLDKDMSHWSVDE